MRLIDADECLTFLKENCSEDMYLAVRAILDPCNTVQAIPIPKNATNGDVILAIFKEIQHYSDGKICADWWNAPYKRGDENGSN